MRERLKLLKRIVKVREQMAQAAEWSRAAGERRIQETEADRCALDAFVDSGLGAGGLAAAALRQTQRLARRQESLRQDQLQLAARALEARRLQKQAEGVAAEVIQIERADRERRELEGLIDAMLSSSGEHSADLPPREAGRVPPEGRGGGVAGVQP